MWDEDWDSEIEQEPGGCLDIAVLAVVVLIIVGAALNIGGWLS